MTLTDTATKFAMLADTKMTWLRENPLGFLIAAIMAGAYVGIGILLILSVGEHADPAVRNLVMGCSFGIALTLVLFAGSELFTGYAMYMSLGLLAGTTSLRDLCHSWAVTWCGNLLGCLLLAYLFIMGGGGSILDEGASLLHTIAAKKMNAPASELFARAMLCNWLVCLAIWSSARTRSDTTKSIIIFWCLFAFIAAGFEHSIANMTIFSVALFAEHPETITLTGAAKNLFWVTLGNAASGTIFIGLAYWIAAGKPKLNTQPEKVCEKP